MIGIGLWDATDISLKGLEIVKNCDKVFLESYTSKLGCELKTMQNCYGKQIIVADRDLVESRAEEILDAAKEGNVAFLVIGDVFAATTHVDLRLRAKEKGIDVKIVHNASVITAVGETGLELYKFGKTVSIPFDNKDVTSPVKAYEDNKALGLHTLFLLDIRMDEDSLMSINHACEYLLKHTDDVMGVGVAGLGSPRPRIVYKKLGELQKADFSIFPQCLIIPGKLHFMEEDSLKQFAKSL